MAARLLTTVSNEAEAHMLLERLSEAGVRAWPSGLPQFPARDIYVEEADLERAREALQAAGLSEAELVQAEEEDAAARRLAQPNGAFREDPPGR
jgi:hypothetical protein